MLSEPPYLRLRRRSLLTGLRPRAGLAGLLPPLVNCALIALVAYALAQLTWRLLLPDETLETLLAVTADSEPPESGAARAGLRPEAPAVLDVATIADWHLFGKLRTDATSAPLGAAPQTRLDLRLAGIFHSESATTPALALIASGRQRERAYRVGDRIAPDVTLTRIDADRVVLERAGRTEILPLPRAGVVGAAGAAGRRDAAGTGPVVGVGNTAAVDETVGEAAGPAIGDAVRVDAGGLAQRLRGDRRPDSLRDVAYATPYLRDGRFVGLQLQPGRQRQLLGRLGLLPGDVLTELNGTPLTDPAQSAQLLEALLNVDQVRAKVIRNGNEMPFTFVLTP